MYLESPAVRRQKAQTIRELPLRTGDVERSGGKGDNGLTEIGPELNSFGRLAEAGSERMPTDVLELGAVGRAESDADISRATIANDVGGQ